MKNRSLEYEKRIRAYLFKGDIKRFKAICKEIGIINNLNCLKELEGGNKE